MPPFGAWERVKGKRVQIPHDLVTVIREPAARVHLHRSLGFDPGRRRQALSFQPGNLPAAGYGGAPPQITRNWLYRKCSDDTPGSFCVAVLYILYVSAAQRTSAFLMGFMVYLKENSYIP